MIALPFAASAQTGGTQIVTLDRITELLKQIENLQKQITALKAQQVQIVSDASSLIGTLEVGARGDKVKTLQAVLAADSTVYPEGIISGYYGNLTTAAVKRYQKKYGIEQAGNVGPKTLMKLKKDLEDRPIAFEDDDGDDARGEKHGTRVCTHVPPGHLIAPGWLKKNGMPIVLPCQKLPPGIDDKISSSTSDRSAPSITSLMPSSGATGTIVTISGSRFASLNTVRFGNGYVNPQSPSADGKTLIFAVPTFFYHCAPTAAACTAVLDPLVTPGTYPVSVITKHGISNSLPFTVTAPITTPTSTPTSTAGISAQPLGVTTNRAKSVTDDLGTLTFSASTAGLIVLNQITLTVTGSAPSNAAFLDGLALIDENTAVSLGTGNTTSSACNGTNICTKTFMFGSGANGQVVGAGTSRTFRVRANSISHTAPAVAGVSQTLSVSIATHGDVRFTNGLDNAATTNIPLASSIPMPLSVNSVSYAVGS